MERSKTAGIPRKKQHIANLQSSIIAKQLGAFAEMGHVLGLSVSVPNGHMMETIPRVRATRCAHTLAPGARRGERIQSSSIEALIAWRHTSEIGLI